MRNYDVTVIGGGPAGLAAALAAREKGASVCLIEREARLGGILKQCIHDGFGLLRFGEKLSGPEYVERFMEKVEKSDIDCLLLTFVTAMEKEAEGFKLTVVNRSGVSSFHSKTIVLATGCRERTAKQVSIHGTRPSGVFTAGSAQNLVNLHGQMVTKRCVILGSGDIGLIMARRLTLEGAEVLGVYEVKSEPSGLTRNIVQCLHDYDIPLHLSHTVTRVFGQERLTGVEVAQVRADMKPIPGTEEQIECDALILSVGLIPENELAESLGVKMDSRTKGASCDQHLMTSVPGVFACGNCLHVNDLVDYVSESGELAGEAAARYAQSMQHGWTGSGGQKAPQVEIRADRSLLYVVPQRILLPADDQPVDDLLAGETGSETVSDQPADGLHAGDQPADDLKEVVLYFRSSSTMEDAQLEIAADGQVLITKKYRNLRPPEMEKLVVNFSSAGLKPGSTVTMTIRKGGEKA